MDLATASLHAQQQAVPARSLAVRVLPLSRELSNRGLIDEPTKTALKELAFAHDADLAFIVEESETSAAPLPDVAESLTCLIRARRSADGRLRLHHSSALARPGHLLHDLLLFQWENFTSVLWFRVWDAILVRLIRLICRRFPVLSFLLLWLVDDEPG